MENDMKKPEFEVGDMVLDDLTGKIVKIVKITKNRGVIGYWVDDEYLSGGRHPWEITKLWTDLKKSMNIGEKKQIK